MKRVLIILIRILDKAYVLNDNLAGITLWNVSYIYILFTVENSLEKQNWKQRMAICLQRRADLDTAGQSNR